MGYSLPGSSVHGFPRQEYWSGLPFPFPKDLPDPIPIQSMSPALTGRFFTTEPPGKPKGMHCFCIKKKKWIYTGRKRSNAHSLQLRNMEDKEIKWLAQNHKKIKVWCSNCRGGGLLSLSVQSSSKGRRWWEPTGIQSRWHQGRAREQGGSLKWRNRVVVDSITCWCFQVLPTTPPLPANTGLGTHVYI